jgi:hypothetical protein
VFDEGLVLLNRTKIADDPNNAAPIKRATSAVKTDFEFSININKG